MRAEAFQVLRRKPVQVGYIMLLGKLKQFLINFRNHQFLNNSSRGCLPLLRCLLFMGRGMLSFRFKLSLDIFSAQTFYCSTC
ncbi:hypothetical protein Pint_26267 [Pistacia integerrima]|uniref:Uncharacterized protein n=1 Tax=Pistacia integerrima TaxID=434235 RepID=A0ACC0YDN6_9ROSI|nr:hypothetical protein Pint_26267 [Pistacia integerrima]